MCYNYNKRRPARPFKQSMQKCRSFTQTHKYKQSVGTFQIHKFHDFIFLWFYLKRTKQITNLRSLRKRCYRPTVHELCWFINEDWYKSRNIWIVYSVLHFRCLLLVRYCDILYEPIFYYFHISTLNIEISYQHSQNVLLIYFTHVD
jgi:hypothetical protein